VFPIRLRFTNNVNPLMDKDITGEKLFHWLPAIPLHTMKKVRRLCGGVTVNDIVSTATSRAFWRYLLYSEKRAREGTGISDEISLTIEQEEKKKAMDEHSAVEKSVLAASKNWTVSEGATMACWLKFPTTLQNRFGVCAVHSRKPGFVGPSRGFEVSDEDLIADLLYKKKEVQVCMKERRYGFGGFLVMSMITNVFPRFVTNVVLKPPQGVSYVWSNVRGPADAIECQGVPMTKAYAFPPNMGRAGGLYR
jgi:hypothetical protein